MACDRILISFRQHPSSAASTVVEAMATQLQLGMRQYLNHRAPGDRSLF